MVDWVKGPLPAPLGFTGGYTWDQWAPYLSIAEDPSGDPTAVNPRSTASGLYQITNPTWAQYGGLNYAPTAGQATPDQQYQIGQAIFEARGAQPWATAQTAYNNLSTEGIAGGDPGGSTFYNPGSSDPLATGGLFGSGADVGSYMGGANPAPMGTPGNSGSSAVGGAASASTGWLADLLSWVETEFANGIVMIIGVILVAGAIFLMAGHEWSKGAAHA